MPTSVNEIDTRVYANFATTSRLVVSLVTEGLCLAYFLPAFSCQSYPSYSASSAPLVGFALLLRHARALERLEPATLTSNVLVVIPLRGLPILHPTDFILSCSGSRRLPRIEVVDPWEMITPHLFTLYDANTCQKWSDTGVVGDVQHHEDLKFALTDSAAELDKIQIRNGLGALQLWSSISSRQDIMLSPEINDEIKVELQSSLDFQKYNYDNPKPLPSLKSSTIEWEQCNLEGHPTHPMHKQRRSYPPMPPLTPGMIDLDHPRIRLASFPRHAISFRGDFEDEIRPLIEHMLGDKREADAVYLPVHEFQLQTLLEKFPIAQAVDEVTPVRAHSLTSIRSMALPELLPGKCLKLCLGIRVSGALRTVSPFSAFSGPGFSMTNVPHLCYDRDILTVEREIASAFAHHEDPNVARHASCIVRDAVEFGLESEQDIIIPCASLLERIQIPNTYTTLVAHVFSLNTETKRQAFLYHYVDVILRAFLPPALTNGVAFEAHSQNTLARFDRATGELKGFLIRDFGGIRVHRETLLASTGVDLDGIATGPIVAKDLSDVTNKLYHALFRLHLQRLIRVLDLHNNGFGWHCVREALDRNFPDHKSEIFQAIRTQTHLAGKCMVRMRMAGLYCDYIWNPLPNLVLYQPQKVAEDGSVSVVI